MMGKVKDMTNQKFGRLTVIRRDLTKPNHDAWWICECDCGNIISTTGSRLRDGSCQSCGCLQKELLAERNKTHGETKTRLYNLWSKIKLRCYNKKSKDYDNYGGRGILMCSEWKKDFMSFKEWALSNGYDENASYGGCTIDRIDVNGNYEPNNCRFTTIKEQSRNTRFNRRYEYQGKSLCTEELAEIAGISGATLRYRLNVGYTLEEAMFTKLHKNKGRKVNYAG